MQLLNKMGRHIYEIAKKLPASAGYGMNEAEIYPQYLQVVWGAGWGVKECFSISIVALARLLRQRELLKKPRFYIQDLILLAETFLKGDML